MGTNESSPRRFEELPEMMTRPELAAYTAMAVQTLARWAVEGTGPRVTHLGGAVRYRKDDVLAWLESSAAPSRHE